MVAGPLATMLLTLCPVQKRCPRCVRWIDLRHWQHLTEVLVGQENSYVVTRCLQTSFVFPTGASTPSSHSLGNLGLLQEADNRYLDSLRFGFNFKLGWQTGLYSHEKRIPLSFPAFLTFKPSSYTHPPLQNFLVQTVIWATGKGTNSEFPIFIPVCNQWEHAVTEMENYEWIKAD